MIRIGGIDPGKTGALATLCFDRDGSVITGIGDMLEPRILPVPLLKVKGKDGIDYVALASQWLPEIEKCDEIVIELVHTMPKQGIASSGKFMYSAGFIYGLVAGSKRPHTFMTPQSWKKIVNISGNDGEVSRRRAGQLMPELVGLWPLKKHDGLAEAALMSYAWSCVRREPMGSRSA